jgi:DNA gyrase inhibitor GyrI
MKQETALPVKVELEKTVIRDMRILYIKDTALTTETIKGVLAKGSGELMPYIQSHHLQPRKFMAWYYSAKPPWPVEVAVETESLNALLSGRIQSRIVTGGGVIIAHMWGPYDQVSKAYEKIQQWLKENNQKARGNPFEVYINDPAMVSSPADIQTDIYQPI